MRAADLDASAGYASRSIQRTKGVTDDALSARRWLASGWRL